MASLIGPGTWFVFHRLAIKSTTIEKCYQYIEMVETIVEGFPCKECITHAKYFMELYPMRNYIELYDRQGNRIGMFEWSREFHNSVNSRLNKNIFTFDQAWNIYTDSKICNGNCFVDESNTKPQLITKGSNQKFKSR